MDTYNAEATVHLAQRAQRPGSDEAIQATLRPIFTDARRAAQRRRLWGWMRGRETRLHNSIELLCDAQPTVLHTFNIQAIPLQAIIGSEGRSAAFDRSFAPLCEYTRERWQSVAAAWMAGKPLPPVRLIRIDEQYIVRDGHHRISVAAIFGAATIEAIVEQAFVRIAQPVRACTPLCAC